MGKKMGRRARKFAKKNLQPVMKRKRKLNALFQKKFAPREANSDSPEESKNLKNDMQTPVDSEQEILDGIVSTNPFGDLFTKEEDDSGADVSDSDGYLSEVLDTMNTRKKAKSARDDDKYSHTNAKDKQQDQKEGAEDSQDIGLDGTTQTTRSKRGRTQMNKLVVQRVHGVKQSVKFNEYGQPVGQKASELQSFIGVLAREKVNINYHSWKQVPNEVKNMIWESVNLTYQLDPKWRNGCLSSANSKWRQYKTHLTRTFIQPNKNNPKLLNKVPQGHCISREDWSSFVINRMSEDFIRKSELQSQRSKANLYPHRLSRKGYAGLSEEISNVLCDDDEINRAILWKRGRLNKAGEFVGDELKQTVNKIDDYIVQKKDGKLSFTKPFEDILTKALNSNEHGGRVRGIGANVTPSSFFKVARGKVQIDKDAYDKQQKEFKEAKAMLSEQGERIEKLEAMMLKLSGREFESEEKGSCSVKPQCLLDRKPEVERHRRLSNEGLEEHDDDDDDVIFIEKDSTLQGKTVMLLLQPNDKTVAYGTIVSVNGPDNFIDDVPLPVNCMRIAIDKAIDQSAPLPVAIPFACQSIGDAVGGHVAWPVHLINMRDEKTRKKKVDNRKEKSKLQWSNVPRPLHILYSYFQRLDETENVILELVPDVFGMERTVHVNCDDIFPFCELKPITDTCIVVYMWHLYRKMQEKMLLQDFRLVDPVPVEYVPSRNQNRDFIQEQLNKRASYLSSRLIGTSTGQLVVVPCNVGFHWILTIINVEKEIIFLLDPLSHRIRDQDWKYIVNMALKMYNAEVGRKGKKQPTWVVVKAPQQPDAEQCGFYIMRYMKDIIENFGVDHKDSLPAMEWPDEKYPPGSWSRICSAP